MTQIVNRWQQGRVAREALDRILAQPVDMPAEARRIHKPVIEGASRCATPSSAMHRIDGVEMDCAEPADTRRDIGRVGQVARLFHGSLRKNLILGAPSASDTAILAQLNALTLRDFVDALPDGLDHPIQEGRGVSTAVSSRVSFSHGGC